MTDKKKLDEAVTLTMNSDQGEIQMNSTVVANDLTELAMLLKNSGIVADDFQGPASLSQDEEGISTNVSAPNLRAIMNMLEPVFQAVGDMEADMMEPAVCDQAIAEPEMDAVAVEPEADFAVEPEMEIEPEMGDEIYDPGMGPDDFSPDKEMAPEPEMGDEMEVDEADWSSPDAHATKLDIFTVQVECAWSRESDEPEFDDEEEQADWTTNWETIYKDFKATSWQEAKEMAENELEEWEGDDAQSAMFELIDAGWSEGRSGMSDDEPGMKVLNIEHNGQMVYTDGDVNEEADYDYRTHDVHPTTYPAASSKEIVQPKTHTVPARSSDNPLDEQSGGGAVGQKRFMDYVKEAELNELSKGAISRYTKKVNDHGDDDMDDETARKRGRGLSMAGDKVHWKDAKVLATENTFEGLMAQLDDYLGEDLKMKIGKHEITFMDPADDEIEDLEKDSPEKLEKITKDISADMHEDEELNERPMPPRPTDFNSVARRAKEDSKNGYVQHVDRHEDGQHSVSDWMSDDTVASFSNGHHTGGQDIDEDEQLDEISSETKDAYFAKAAKQFGQHSRMKAMHSELSNDEMAAQHDKFMQKRATGMGRSVKEDEAEAPAIPQYEIQGSSCDYKIVDVNTGEVVANNIFSGHEAHNELYWYQQQAKRNAAKSK